MGLFSWGFKSSSQLAECEIPNIFPLSLSCKSFVKSDVLNTYLKILTDTMERTHGLSEKQSETLWDNCLQSEANQGLISLLAHAMADRSDLFLVYKAEVLRKADQAEEKKIRADYEKRGSSSVGVYISFKNYLRTDMLLVYSEFEHCILSSLNKTLNLSKAIQIKLDGLRTNVSLNDIEVPRAQGRAIAKALSNGNDSFMDAKDVIETAQVDTAPTEKAMLFLDSKRAFYLGLPLSYLSGEQTPGIGATGEADMRAVERGLKQYYVSILRPTLKALFAVETEFKSEDFRLMTTSLQALRDFDLTSNENLSAQTKRELTALMFNLDPDEEQRRLDAEAAEREAQAQAEQDLAMAQANATANPQNDSVQQ